MKIELFIDGAPKVFVAPFVPMLAKRKYLEIETRMGEKKEFTNKDVLDEDDELLSILVDIVFRNQFTLDQLYAGASWEYIKEKLMEAAFNMKPKSDEEDSEGNLQGE